MYNVIRWANQNDSRWAFTLSNAGSYHFEDRSDTGQLDEIDWAAVQATSWQQCREGKQAEFLIERGFPWTLVERIGVGNSNTYRQATIAIRRAEHRPPVEIKREWYY